MAQLILPMLEQLRSEKDSYYHSYPSELVSDRGEYWDEQLSLPFIDRDAECRASHDAASKRWTEIVDEMIWSFERIVLDPGMVHTPESFGDDFYGYQDAVQNGLDHFATHFFSLAY